MVMKWGPTFWCATSHMLKFQQVVFNPCRPQRSKKIQKLMPIAVAKEASFPYDQVLLIDSIITIFHMVLVLLKTLIWSYLWSPFTNRVLPSGRSRPFITWHGATNQPRSYCQELYTNHSRVHNMLLHHTLCIFFTHLKEDWPNKLIATYPLFSLLNSGNRRPIIWGNKIK